MGGMVEKIVSFGDSFILGSEQVNNEDGSLAWPGRIADRLNLDSETMAVAGCGNEHIAQQIFHYFSTHSPANVLAVINWTWALRWDINLGTPESWVGLGPTCVPDKLKSMVAADKAQQLINFYQTYAASNSIWNQQRSLMAIYAAQSFLKANGIDCIQTYMDRSIWFLPTDRLDHYNAVRLESWPRAQTVQELDKLPQHIALEAETRYQEMQPPSYIEHLQKLTWPEMQSFDGLDFLSWSQRRGYQITELLHPLEDAHLAAADHWLEVYRTLCQ